jgi:hypothetical protein
MNSLWDLLHTMKHHEKPRETKHPGENCLHRRLSHHESMADAFQANGMPRIDIKHSLAPVSPIALPFMIDGSAYGIRLGLFAGVRRCSPHAYFLVSLFTAERCVLLEVVDVAVQQRVQPSSWHSLMTLPRPARGGHDRRNCGRSSHGLRNELTASRLWSAEQPHK